MNINDITITSLETITAFDIVTGNYQFTLDELQNATIAQTQDAQEITGKGGRKLAKLKRNKAVTVSATNGLVSGGLLEMQTGGSFENKLTEVLWTDNLAVSSGKAVTTYTAVGESGAEIEGLYIRNTDGTLGEALEQADTAAAGKFAYNAESKTVSFSEDMADNTEIVVYYKRRIKADVLENKSDKYSGKSTLFIDALGEDKCSNVYRIQFYIPKADFNGEFSFEMDENQTVHTFDAEALAGSCRAGKQLWTYTIFGADANDAA